MRSTTRMPSSSSGSRLGGSPPSSAAFAKSRPTTPPSGLWSGWGSWREHQPLIIVAGLMASTQSSWGSIVPVLPLHAQALGASLSAVGIVIGAFGLGRLVVNIPASRLCEFVDPRTVLLIASVANAILGGIAGMVGSVGHLVALRFLTGVAGGAAITAGSVLIAMIARYDSRAKSMSVLYTMQLAGSALGPGYGGIIASAFGARAAFWCSGALSVPFVAWALVSLPRSGRPLAPSSADDAGEHRVVSGALAAAYSVSFGLFFFRFGQQTLLPLLGDQEFGIGPASLGMALSVVAVLSIAATAAVGGLSDRIGRRVVIVPSLLGIAVASFGFAMAPNPAIFYFTMVVVGLLTSVNGSAPMAYLTDIVPSHRYARSIGMYRTFGDLACVLAPIIVATLLEAFGAVEAVLSLVVVVGATAGIFWYLAPETVSRSGRIESQRQADFGCSRPASESELA